MAITYRLVKGSELTFVEMDGNFQFLESGSIDINNSFSSFTSSINTFTSSINNFSSSYSTGSFTGSFTGDVLLSKTLSSGGGISSFTFDGSSNATISLKNNANLVNNSSSIWNSSNSQFQPSIIGDNGSTALINGGLTVIGDTILGGTSANQFEVVSNNIKLTNLPTFSSTIPQGKLVVISGSTNRMIYTDQISNIKATGSFSGSFVGEGIPSAGNGLTYNSGAFDLGGTIGSYTGLASNEVGSSEFIVELEESVSTNGTYFDNYVDATSAYINAGITVGSDSAVMDISNTGVNFAFNSKALSFSATQMLVRDQTSSKGLEYFADYSSANASNDRWLVDKGYVDSNRPTAGSGLTNNSGAFDLGGTLAANTTLTRTDATTNTLFRIVEFDRTTSVPPATSGIGGYIGIGVQSNAGNIAEAQFAHVLADVSDGQEYSSIQLRGLVYGTVQSLFSINTSAAVIDNVAGHAVRIGANSIATGGESIAIGQSAYSTGTRAVSIGGNGIADAINAIKIGYAGSAGGANDIVFGANTTSTGTGTNKLIIGEKLQASGMGASIIGYYDATGIRQNSLSDSLEVVFDGVRAFKTGVTLGTQVTVSTDPDTLLTSTENGAVAYDSTDHQFRVYVNSGWDRLALASEVSGGVSQLSDLSDVSSATNTNKFALISNGTTYEGRALAASDITAGTFGTGAYSITGSLNVDSLNFDGNRVNHTTGNLELNANTITDSVVLYAGGNSILDVSITYGLTLIRGGSLYLSKQSAENADQLGYGQLWVNSSDGTLHYKYSGSADIQLGSAGTETNDLSAAVTWVTVPDTYISQGSVTQHSASFSITEAQIVDLQTYATASTTLAGYGITDGTSMSGATANGVLTYNSAGVATVEANATFDGTRFTISNTGGTGTSGGNLLISALGGSALIQGKSTTAASNGATFYSSIDASATANMGLFASIDSSDTGVAPMIAMVGYKETGGNVANRHILGAYNNNSLLLSLGNGGSLFLAEQAAVDSDITGMSQLWIDSTNKALHYKANGVADQIVATLNPKTQTVSDAATVTATSLNEVIIITALAQACAIAAPTGTFTDGQPLLYRIKDDSTTRAITFNAVFVDWTGTLASNVLDTTAGKETYVSCIYNTASSKFNIIGIITDPN